jgi:16S rRNA (guanine966-N2)-methyltransferase
MRIIAGVVGGRVIRAPRGMATRPTSDRVREAVFNILGPPDADSRVLDLYAGAGALGIEALSRGAAEAVFVDRDSQAIRCVEENLAELGLKDRARISRGEAVKAVDRLDRAGERFAWVFIDPPYASGEYPKVLAALGQAGLLADEGVVIVEHDKRHTPDPAYGALACSDSRRYGETCVSFYRRRTADS